MNLINSLYLIYAVNLLVFRIMKTIFWARKLSIILFVLIFSTPLYSDQINDDSHLGFTFGMSSNKAKDIIGKHGNLVIKNDIDSKKVRTILFEGIVIEYPAVDDSDKKTRLEFFDDKLMSTQLIVKKLDGSQFIGIRNQILADLESKYGKYSSKDNMLSYDIWTWSSDHLTMVLSTNRKKGEVKLEYTYKPVAAHKTEKELDVKRQGEKRHPVDQMFKDGNYSQQGGPAIKRQGP